jgi:hypothetical protein
VDSGATSHMGTIADSAKQAFVPTTQPSHKIFQLPNRARTAAKAIHHLHHTVRPPANKVHMVPSIKTNSLLSTAKFAQAGYITVFDNEEVNIYNASNTKVNVT